MEGGRSNCHCDVSALIESWKIMHDCAQMRGLVTHSFRHERKMPARHAPGQPALHATVCWYRRRCSPQNRRLARTSPSSTRKVARPARAAQLPSDGRALQPAAQRQRTAPAAQPRTGQVTAQIANTRRNTRMRPPRSCYSYCMNFPGPGRFHRFPCSSPSDT
jgi:hypothetical protein